MPKTIHNSPVLLPGLVSWVDPRAIPGVGNTGANVARACRVVVPKSGTLRDLAVWIGTSSGNIDVGVYDTQATRNKLYSTGSIACPAGSAWQVVGDPNLAVKAGDELDFVIAGDNTTFTIGRISTGATDMSILPTNFLPSHLGAAPKLTWQKSASFALPTTFAEAGITGTSFAPVIIARVA